MGRVLEALPQLRRADAGQRKKLDQALAAARSAGKAAAKANATVEHELDRKRADERKKHVRDFQAETEAVSKLLRAMPDGVAGRAADRMERVLYLVSLYLPKDEDKLWVVDTKPK